MKKLCGWLSLTLLIISLISYPTQSIIDSMYGVEGWEMTEVYPEMISEAQADSGAFIEQFGSSENEPLSEQLSYVGRPGPFTEQGQIVRFLFVPGDRIISSSFGTLIVFDRSASQELLQSRSLRNISLIIALSSDAGGLFFGGLWLLLRRRSPPTKT